jgi:chromate transporter
MSETDRDEASRDATSPVPLRQLALVFLKLGVIGFGGPAAHIAMMEDEVVRRRRWLPRDEFLDLLGATNLIPGPNSTEMAIHIGRRKAGWTGLLVAGSCFILPAAFIVTAFAWAYVRYGSLPQTKAIMYGVKPVIIAIILQALWGLGTTALKTRSLALVGAAGIILGFLGVHELAIIFGGGVVVGSARFLMRLKRRGAHDILSIIHGAPFAILAQMTTTAGAAASSFGLWPLFLFFLKVGSVLFGSGYVLLAFLRSDMVERWHWLTEGQLLDAIAVGQVTPGPVFTTATFIGYVLGGYTGAVVATAGIFLPAFFFVADPKVGDGGRVSGRRERSVTVSDGGGDLAAWPRGVERLADSRSADLQPGFADALSCQFRLAGVRRSNYWLTTSRANLIRGNG